ncbi:MAG TPA: matrixin family metalloprotease [Gemmatimonadales bacterium]|nr:matrixin family metalloprotease [Gemmatimonadales bacterium]
MLRRLLAGLLLALVAVAVTARVERQLRSAPKPALPAPSEGTQRELTLSPADGDHVRRHAIDFPGPPPVPLDSSARATARLRLGVELERHYLDSLFARSDSVVRHWPVDGPPIALSIVPGGPSGFLPEMTAEVRQALDAWSPAMVGVRFVEQDDTVGAAMVIRWTDTLESDRAGATDVTWDRAGRIRHVLVNLTTRSPSTGRPYAPETRRAIVLHELGHALGLPHSSHQEDVMYPVATATELTDRDRFSLHLLYELPIGWVGAGNRVTR